ncbi:MAG: AmmeMemoRadiSam system radical SAM enzyme [Tissierellia bacterium]|nr:AmmeMemoRadiSam system radical SAM enzyme [Tissierellia bacterium]
MNNTITCDLCPRYCTLKEGAIGFCNARKNVNGKILSLNYGKLLSLVLDPIEKKPLAYYKPGSMILSVGTFGCNMNCQFCQNYEIARAKETDYRTYDVSSEDLIKIAIDKKQEGNIGIAFTYNEPLVGFEYVLDTSKLAKANDLDAVVVTNGQINENYLKELLPFISAWNIDLKSFSEEGYKKLGGDFKTTLKTIELTSKTSHIEVTTLVVPGISDDLNLMEEEAKFLASLDKNIPLHINRYIPRYKYNEPATDIKLLLEMEEIAKEYLNRVSIGNI